MLLGAIAFSAGRNCTEYGAAQDGLSARIVPIPGAGAPVSQFRPASPHSAVSANGRNAGQGNGARIGLHVLCPLLEVPGFDKPGAAIRAFHRLAFAHENSLRR